MKLTEGEFKFLSSTCGAIFHCLTTNNQTTISDYQAEYLNSFFNVRNEKYAITKTGGNSIKIENEKATIHYVHNDFMSSRNIVVELKEVELKF
jgi:hypothetical protein